MNYHRYVEDRLYNLNSHNFNDFNVDIVLKLIFGNNRNFLLKKGRGRVLVTFGRTKNSRAYAKAVSTCEQTLTYYLEQMVDDETLDKILFILL